MEGVDIGRCAEPGLAPGVLAERLGQSFLQMLDARVVPGSAFVGGEQVGLQRGSGDRRPDGFGTRGWLRFEGVELGEQVAVSVEEAAVDTGGAGDPGDTEPQRPR